MNQSVTKEAMLNVFSIGENSLNKLYRQGVVNREDDAFRKTKDATVKMVSICDDVDINDYKLTPKQQKVAELLTVVDKASVKEVCYYTGYTQSVTDSLVKKKIARYFTDEVMRIPYSDEVVLSQAQHSAFDNLYSKYCDYKASVSLLYGVTGSGKTAVFMKLIEKCFNDNKGTILMVPEIALTPQLIKIFTSRFGDNVAVFHSGLSIGERLDEYKRVSKCSFCPTKKYRFDCYG